MDYFVEANGQRVMVETAVLSRCMSDTHNTCFDGSSCRVTAFMDIDLGEAATGDGGVFDLEDGRSAFGDIAVVALEGDEVVVFFLDEDATID